MLTVVDQLFLFTEREYRIFVRIHRKKENDERCQEFDLLFIQGSPRRSMARLCNNSPITPRHKLTQESTCISMVTFSLLDNLLSERVSLIFVVAAKLLRQQLEAFASALCRNLDWIFSRTSFLLHAFS